MKSAHRFAVIMMACAGALAPLAVAGPEAQVAAQDLRRLKVEGKVTAVVWTRREDACTLQVVLQMPIEYMVGMKVAAQREARGLAPAPPATPKLPQVQAWLLRPDGSVISRSPGTPAFPAALKASDGVPLEVRYSYPVSAANEAVAVAIMVDGVYAIEPLKPFGT